MWCDDNPAQFNFDGIATVGLGWEEMPTKSTAACSNESPAPSKLRLWHTAYSHALGNALGSIDSITAAVAARAVSHRGDGGVRFQHPALLRWPRVGGVEVG